jgi:PKD repeat protein
MPNITINRFSAVGNWNGWKASMSNQGMWPIVWNRLDVNAWGAGADVLSNRSGAVINNIPSDASSINNVRLGYWHRKSGGGQCREVRVSLYLPAAPAGDRWWTETYHRPLERGPAGFRRRTTPWFNTMNNGTVITPAMMAGAQIVFWEGAAGAYNRAGLRSVPELQAQSEGLSIELDYETAIEPVVDFEGEHLYARFGQDKDDPIHIYDGEAIDFTDLSTNVPTSWDWDFETAGTDDVENPTAVVFTSGATFLEYDITLEAENAGGTATETKTAYVVCYSTDFPLEATLTLDPNYVADFPPNDAEFAVDWLGVAETFTFDYDDGSTEDTTSAIRVHTYETHGTFEVEVLVANPYDSVTATTEVIVTSPIPDVDFVADTTEGVAPLTVTFTFSQTGGTATTSWLWDFGDNITSDVEDPIHVYTTNGSYTVSVIGTQRATTDSEEKIDYITVSPSTPVNVEIAFAPTCGYTPFQVDFQMLNVGPGGVESLYVTKEWDFGDGSAVNTTEENPSHVYVTATTDEWLPVLTLNKGMGSEFVVSASIGEGVNVFDENDWGRFMEELGWHVFQRYSGELCDAWEQYGGIDKVIDIAYDRYSRFLLETGIFQNASAATEVSANIWTLPSDLVELRRLEADGLQIDPVDPREADLYDSDWETAGTEILGYIFEPHEGTDLTVQIIPVTAVPSAVEVLYVAPPARPTVPTNCGCDNVNFWDALDLPYVYWWILRSGILSDLLRQEGDMQDINRATKLDAQWQGGIGLVKALQDAKG